MSKNSYLLFLILVFITTTCTAKSPFVLNEKKIKVENLSCKLTQKDKSSAMYQLDIQSANLEKIDQELNKAHQDLMNLLLSYKNLNYGFTNSMEELHTKWIEYRGAECRAYGNQTMAGGNWAAVHSLRCEINLAEKKLEDLQKSFACLKKNKTANYYLGEDCLSSLLIMRDHF